MSMAYVLEEFTSPQQQAEFAQLNLASPFTSGPAVVRAWLVDRERGLYFINLGGGGERAYSLVLADRNGVLLRAQGERRATGQFVPKGVDENWSISSASIPKDLASR